jgi:hypothetical protein
MPVSGDIYVFLASSNQVQFQDSSGLMAVLQSWELKPFVNRLVIYGIYKIAYFIVHDFSLKTQFIIAVKTIYLILTCIASFLSVIMIKKTVIKKHGFDTISIFCIVAISMLSGYYLSALQAENTAVIILVLSSACFLSSNKYLQVISGIALPLLFWLKPPFLLLALSLVFVALLLNSSAKKILLTISLGLITFVLSMIFILLYYPQEITFLLAANLFQGSIFDLTLKGIIKTTVVLCYNILKKLLINPVIFVGFICLVLIILHMFKERMLKKMIFLLCVWLCPMVYILVVNHFFSYHFYPLHFPAMVSILYLFSYKNELLFFDKKTLIFSAGAFLVALVFGFFMRVYSNGNINFALLFNLAVYFIWVIDRNLSKEYPKGIFLSVFLIIYISQFFSNGFILSKDNLRNIQFLRQNHEVFTEIANKYELSKQKTILFLDDGTGAFYVSAKSELKFFFPLPLQREKAIQAENDNSWIIETRKQALNYTGEYIWCYDSWIFKGKNQDLLNKINSEYDCVEQIDRLNIDFDLFNAIDEHYVYRLYKRK